MNIKVGTKFKLIEMVNDPNPIPTGSIGEITKISSFFDELICEVKWENSTRTLNICLPIDIIEIIE